MTTATSISRHYGSLTPEERWRLLQSAIARGDEPEKERLVSSAGHINLRMRDIAPYLDAAERVEMLMFLELLGEAGGYLEAMERGDEASEKVWQRFLDVALAKGFHLKTKADGWKLWCERMGMQPFARWEGMPGFDRLKLALDMVDGTEKLHGAVFVAEGMLAWLNRIRPKGEPKALELYVSPEKVADELEGFFRQEVKRQGG
jgi:hypothetical protein